MKRIALASCMAVALTPGMAGASEVVYGTADPWGSFGLIGFDVFNQQWVATRFTPQGNYTLDSVRPWFMNNSNTFHPSVTISLRNDKIIGGESFPGEEIFESWTFNISALGWNPVQEELTSMLNPLLEEGVNYWLVAQSDAAAGANAVWNWAQPGNGWMSTCNPSLGLATCQWSPASTGAVVAVTVEGTPATPSVPGDLNGDGVVDVSDLLILLAAWGPCPPEGDCPADLNGDGTVDVSDLLILLGNWG